MNKLPKAKLENIVVQNLSGETLIYNLTTNQAFCLNDTSSKVFESCDGKMTFDELKIKYRLTDEIIYLALDELKKRNLIEEEYVSPFAGLSRREVIRKVGLASMIALPVISSLVAPTSGSAASGRGNARYFQACQTDSDCSGTLTCQTSSNAQGGSSQVCCNTRFGNFDRIGPGVPTAPVIFANCGSCGSGNPLQEDRCCSQFRVYSGTCTPNSEGTVDCSYKCT